MRIRGIHIAGALLLALVIDAVLVALLSHGPLTAATKKATSEVVSMIPMPPPTPVLETPTLEPEAPDVDAVADQAPALPQVELRAPTLPSAFTDPGVGAPEFDIGETTNLTPRPTKPRAKPQIQEADQVDEPPRRVHRTMPRYPPAAEERGIEGVVSLRVLIDATGQVARARVVAARPPGLFEESAVAAVKAWRFTPARNRGQAVPVWATLSLRFELE